MYKVEVGEAVKELIEDVKDYQKQDDLDGMIERLKKMTENPSAIIAAMPRFMWMTMSPFITSPPRRR